MHRRLSALGYEPAPDEHGTYGKGSEEAVRAFQQARGLRVDGICGRQTWSALVEAGYALGDRLLYHRSPPLRGDDVGELQRRLGALGFDAGRVDAIFGERTAHALADFQRNAGLTTDGICGPATIAALDRLGGRPDVAPESVAGIRERETLLRSPRTLEGRRLVVGQSGGLDSLLAAVARALAEGGAHVLPLGDPDDSLQAEQANSFAAEAYIGLAGGAEGCVAAYYATEGFESAGGRRLATLLHDEIDGTLRPGGTVPSSAAVRGMRLPILRETRMPAVVCEVGPIEAVVERAADVAAAVRRALTRWVDAPVER